MSWLLWRMMKTTSSRWDRALQFWWLNRRRIRVTCCWMTIAVWTTHPKGSEGPKTSRHQKLQVQVRRARNMARSLQFNHDKILWHDSHHFFHDQYPNRSFHSTNAHHLLEIDQGCEWEGHHSTKPAYTQEYQHRHHRSQTSSRARHDHDERQKHWRKDKE